MVSFANAGIAVNPESVQTFAPKDSSVAVRKGDEPGSYMDKAGVQVDAPSSRMSDADAQKSRETRDKFMRIVKWATVGVVLTVGLAALLTPFSAPFVPLIAPLAVSVCFGGGMAVLGYIAFDKSDAGGTSEAAADAGQGLGRSDPFALANLQAAQAAYDRLDNSYHALEEHDPFG